jgi:hypothetical protein
VKQIKFSRCFIRLNGPIECCDFGVGVISVAHAMTEIFFNSSVKQL